MHVNETKNLKLPQWVPTGVPQWSEVDQAFNDIDLAYAEQRAAISVNTDAIETLSTALDSEEEATTEMLQDIITLQDFVEGQIVTNTSVDNSIRDIQDLVNSELDVIGDLAEAQNLTATSVNENAGLIEGLADAQAVIAVSVDRNASELDTIKNAVSATIQNVAEQKTMIDTLSSNVDSCNADINTVFNNLHLVCYLGNKNVTADYIEVHNISVYEMELPNDCILIFIKPPLDDGDQNSMWLSSKLVSVGADSNTYLPAVTINNVRYDTSYSTADKCILRIEHEGNVTDIYTPTLLMLCGNGKEIE